jgi:endogenous inhibitor of DNA gyrase (YacG/DUF329 family)
VFEQHKLFLMPSESSPKLHCPICKKEVERGGADSPFCSERCRTIDLGKWASGAYVIPSPLSDTEESIEHILRDRDDKDEEE